MATRFINSDRDTPLLLLPDLLDRVPADHLVHFWKRAPSRRLRRSGRAWPKFASDAEERKFLQSYSFAAYFEAKASGDLAKSRQAASRVRSIRFKADEDSWLASEAARRQTSISAVGRDLVRGGRRRRPKAA